MSGTLLIAHLGHKSRVYHITTQNCEHYHMEALTTLRWSLTQ